MEIRGYKCFNNNLINSYGKKFEVGKIYVATGALKFGYKGNGFHLCKNIEDTFRFFDTSKKDICVCEVIGSGNIIEYEDKYNGYFNMYCVERLKIEKELSRQEIINEGLNLGFIRAERFVSMLSLTSQEIEIFKEKYRNNINVLKAISYYQEGNTEVYKKLIIKK